jgi:hypothetical protein
MEFYDMVASAGAGISLAEITKAQQSDRFASQMSAFLTKEVLPSDENLIEVLRTIANAPFYAVDRGTLVRITKGKALKPPADGPDISSVDTIKNAPQDCNPVLGLGRKELEFKIFTRVQVQTRSKTLMKICFCSSPRAKIWNSRSKRRNHEGFRAGSRSEWAGSRFAPDCATHAGGY